MASNTYEQEKLKAFAVAYCEGKTEGVTEVAAVLKKLGKKAYQTAIEAPELLIFMMDYSLISIGDVDKYLVDVSWIDHPKVIEKLLNYKKNPPKIQIEEKEKKEAAAAADPINNWITEKIEDGTLRLVSYKGTDTDIQVPTKLGKAVVSTIGAHAFTPNKPRLKKEMAEQRKKIRSVEIPEGITIWEDDPSNMWSYVGAFQGCSALDTLRIPSSIKKLPKGLCRSSGIKEVFLPDGLEVIEAEAFRECLRLKRISFPPHIKEMQSSLFFRSILLEEFNWLENDGTTVLPSSIFSWCTNLKIVKLPNTLTKIESNAFTNCVKLAELTIPDSVAEIERGAFSSCHALEELHIPEGVREIKEGTFTNCKKLMRLYLPASIESIENGTRSRHSNTRTFEGCESLVICAPAGSYAEKYAKDNNIPFEAV